MRGSVCAQAERSVPTRSKQAGPCYLTSKSTRSVNKHCSVVREQTVMRIFEILFWNNERTEVNRAGPQLDLSRVQSSDSLTNLGNAFTRRGLVKHFWNLNGSEGQPSGPAPPDDETELIPNGTLEPTTASWQEEPVDTEPFAGRNRLVPFRQY